VRGEFLEVEGARLYYYAAGTRGSGEPIVLIHGFPTSSHLWSGVVPLLPKGHRVVVLDLLGFGRSDPPGQQHLTVEAHANRIVLLLESLGIGSATLVGHELGGDIALSVARLAPRKVRRLGLVNPVTTRSWPVGRVALVRALLPLARRIPADWTLGILRAHLRPGYVMEERGAHSIDQYLRPFGSAQGRVILCEHLAALGNSGARGTAADLARVVAPTAVVCGAEDPFTAITVGEAIAAAIPGATLDVVPDIRHFTPEEAPERVAGALTSLLER